MANSDAGAEEVVILGEEFMSEVSSITIPPVQCSFPWNIHPDAQCLKHMSDAWICDRFAKLPHGTRGDGNAFSAELGKAGYELLTSLLHANGKPDRMEPVVKIMAWYFLLDTVMDDPAVMGADVSAVDALITSICAVLEEPTYTYSGENELVRTTVETATEWWHEMRQGMPVSQQTRFIACFKDYLEGNRRQIPYRASRSLPDLDTYFRIRYDAGGWEMCSVLLEYSLAIDFDEETVGHPLVRSLRSATSYNIYWQNDLCSFKKEFLENDLLNLVPVLYAHNLKQKKSGRVTLESVVQEVCKMIKERDEECVRLVSEIKASERLMGKPGMAAYLEGVGNWLGGHMYFQLVTPRYGVCASADMHHQPPDFSSHYHLSLRRRPEIFSAAN